MKVAISTDGTMVAEHFGRCEAYTVVDIHDGQIAGRQILANPGHAPGFLPKYLAEHAVECIVAGGMGPRAKMVFDEQKIATIVGVTGTVSEAIEGLRRGDLQGGESFCDH